MRFLMRSTAVAYCVCHITAAGAQVVGNSITADHRDIGKVQAQIQKYDQAIGVVGQLSRSSSSVECNGVCYFPNRQADSLEM